MTVVQLKGRRDRAARYRHPWVFSGAIARGDGNVAAGDIVDVVDGDSVFVCRGYCNPGSQIRVRALTWDEGTAIDESWWRARIDAAIDARAHLAGRDDTNSYRLVHAEADFLPGLVVDRYADVVVVQFLTAGVDRVRDIVTAAIREKLSPRAIFERSDTASRAREGLKASFGWLLGNADGPLEIIENGLTFTIDVAVGQKTGFYLDQRDNRAAVADHAAGRRVLDAFSYTGAFSAHAARAGAAALTLLDSSAAALNAARVNLERNGIDTGDTEITRGDVFELLRSFKAQGRTFDMVILDPPKFAVTKHQADKAMRAYKDINMLAMQILEPGGILSTFSCSGAVGVEAFTMAVAWAGVDARRSIQIVRRLSQGADHPILASFPESEYLKGLICRIV